MNLEDQYHNLNHDTDAEEQHYRQLIEAGEYSANHEKFVECQDCGCEYDGRVEMFICPQCRATYQINSTTNNKYPF
jgi:Zn finger protein HypA/HybF involved in hydrogenase expression